MSQFCIHCGTENPDEAKFCKNCGQQLKTEEAVQMEAEERAAEEKRKAEEKEATEKEKYSKIGGWLIVYAILLVIGILTSIRNILESYASDEFFTSIEQLFLNGSDALIGKMNQLVGIELLGLFLLFLLAFNFFVKSPHTKNLMITYSLAQLFLIPYSFYILYQMFNGVSMFSNEIIKFIGMSFWTIIWLLYFIFSKRVKKTFVVQEGKDPANTMMTTIFFAALLPGYFGYQYHDKISSMDYTLNSGQGLLEKAVALQDKKQYKEAIPYLQKAAELGDASAKGLLCFSYLEGTGVDKNLYTAITWCEDAYRSTNENGIKEIVASGLGDIYLEKEDFTNGKKWYSEALSLIESETKKSTFAEQIGNKYFNDNHFTTSAYWYQKAVDLGNDSAKFRLAYSYNKRQKYDLAVKYYKEDIKKTDYEGAMHNLGNVYQYGKKDYKKAIYWYNKAIAKKYADYGIFFDVGYAHGKSGNYAEAIRWYEKSIKHDKSSAAMNNLGVIYDQGSGVSVDKQKAFNLFLQAANAGSKVAMNNVAQMYENGEGTYRDHFEAIKWRQRAGQ